MKKKAFTLIELMVVIAIIGVLLAVVSPQVFRQLNKGKTAACEQFYAAVKTSATSFYSDTMNWPSTTANFLQNDTAASWTASWDGPYLDRWQAANPWGGTYSWTSATSTIFGGSAGERYITVTSVPAADAARLDLHIDGVAGSGAGWVRYSGTTVTILVSRDGPVS